MSCKRNGANITQIRCLSVFISLVLRHKPDAAGIQLDEHRWANVNELIDGVNGVWLTKSVSAEYFSIIED